MVHTERLPFLATMSPVQHFEVGFALKAQSLAKPSFSAGATRACIRSRTPEGVRNFQAWVGAHDLGTSYANF